MFLTLLAVPAAGAVTIAGAGGLTVSVESSGAYEVNVSSPAWHFGGNIGYPLSNMTVGSGADALGSYKIPVMPGPDGTASILIKSMRPRAGQPVRPRPTGPEVDR